MEPTTKGTLFNVFIFHSRVILYLKGIYLPIYLTFSLTIRGPMVVQHQMYIVCQSPQCHVCYGLATSMQLDVSLISEFTTNIIKLIKLDLITINCTQGYKVTL